MELKHEQALALKKELEDGLEKWSQQVFEVQESNVKRADEKVEDRNKLRRGREKGVMERRKESKEREAKNWRWKEKPFKQIDKGR